MNNTSLRASTLFPVLLLAASCGDNGIRSYRVPKETRPAAAEHNHKTDQPAPPTLQWKTPAGWEELPATQMRVASFAVTGKDNQRADISVIPLGGMAGSDLDNVNRWRGQVGLPPVTEAELAQLAAAVTVAGEETKLFHLAGTGEPPLSILVTVLRRDGTSWFFKMTGNASLVTEQKPKFIELLQSIQFPAAASAASSWNIPPGWKEVPASQFLVAKFVAGEATVNVSKSAGDGGGFAANVNRWRTQLGLPEADTTPVMLPLAAAGTTAALVELQGEKSGLVGVIVTRSSETWFYKLMGLPPSVAEQKDAFVKFVQGVKY
jgi:hypothetical protein